MHKTEAERLAGFFVTKNKVVREARSEKGTRVMQNTVRVWGTRLMEGVAARHIKTFYAAAFSTIMLAVLINALQPYLLNSVLGLPLRDHGKVSGQVGFVSEVLMIFLVGAFGLISDKKGRRIVYASGFFVMALGFALTPLSTSITLLMITRGAFAVGIAAATAMLATIAADYVQNPDRGKANAIMGIMNGFGAVAAALGLAKLPRLFTALGQDGTTAAWSTYLTAAALAFASGLLMLFGLKEGRHAQAAHEHEPPLWQMAKIGWSAAQNNIGIALSYAAAFVARADLAVAGVYLPLWLTKHHSASIDPSLSGSASLAAIDLAAANGVAAGGKLIAIIGGAGLVFAPVIGILCDRIHRVHALAIGLGLNVLGYGLTFFVKDPTSSFLAMTAMVIGFGQVGAVIASQVLIQDLAPAGKRGAVIGFFGTFGALGIMVTLLAGGFLFDAWMEAGPFVLLAVLNLIVMIAALLLKNRIPIVRLTATVRPASHRTRGVRATDVSSSPI